MHATMPLLMALLDVGGSALAAERDDAATLLAQRLPGAYDNAAQVRREAIARPAIALPVKPQRLTIEPADLPGYGHDVFYAEWRDPLGSITRQRLYVVQPLKDRHHTRLIVYIWTPAIAAQAGGPGRRPWEGLTVADFVRQPDCSLRFRLGRTLSGVMTPRACVFDPPGSPRIYSRTVMRVGSRRIDYLDRWHLMSGREYRRFSTNPHRFERVSAKPTP